MKDKYSLAKCEQYGRRLAARLCDQHFGSQPEATLDGPAVLKFTSVRQVNLLVVRQLLGQWQAETARLRSAYFNFEAAPVQAALSQFMNVLSRHIQLGRAAYEPLLAQAAAQTLGIVADPVDTFQRLLLGEERDAYTVANLRDNLRYFEVDKDFFQGFVDSLPDTELARDFLLHRFELYHAANYKAHQPMQRIVATLSQLLPLTEADLREDGPVSGSGPATLPEETPRPLPPAPVAAPTPPPTIPEAIVPVFVEAPAATPAAQVPPVPAPVPAPEKSVAPVEPTNDRPAPVNGSYSNGTATPATEPLVPLHEKLKATQAAPSPLADALRAGAASGKIAERTAPKVETLREAISINQRFSFINELFNGENMEYHAAVQQLDGLPNAEAARHYITHDLSQRYDWSRKEEHVNKLLKLVERKFA